MDGNKCTHRKLPGDQALSAAAAAFDGLRRLMSISLRTDRPR